MLRALLAVVIATVVTNQAYAISSWQEKYLTIGQVETVELPAEAPISNGTQNVSINSIVDLSESEKACVLAEEKGLSAKTLNLTPKEIAEIVKIGKEVWQIVKKNRPVYNVTMDQIAVIPQKVECWRFLEGWNPPTVRRYRTTFKNLYGVAVVDFQYKVLALTGGSYRGQGKYLARVAMIPELLDVSWGYEFNATVGVPTVLNYGTVVDPVASVELELTYTVDTVFKHTQNTANFLVKGTGEANAL